MNEYQMIITCTIAIMSIIGFTLMGVDKAKAKKMLINYGIGLIVIFVILVAAPLLVKGIAALVT